MFECCNREYSGMLVRLGRNVALKIDVIPIQNGKQAAFIYDQPFP